VLSVTAEISTGSERQNLESVINETYCYWHRAECGPGELARRSAELRQAFTPVDEGWRRQARAAGRQMCQALARFSRLGSSLGAGAAAAAELGAVASANQAAGAGAAPRE
jgi:hypothetical protein